MSGDSLWVRYIGESYRLASRSLSKPIRFLYLADLKAKSPKIKLQKEPTPSKGERPDFGRPFTQVSCTRALCPTRRSVRAMFFFRPPSHSLKEQRKSPYLSLQFSTSTSNMGQKTCTTCSCSHGQYGARVACTCLKNHFVIRNCMETK